MAREHARVKLSIWADEDFRLLSPAAQHLYFLLMTSPKLDYCGVTDWRPARIAQLAGGWSGEAVEIAAQELSEGLYIVIDATSEEVLLRSFVRNDGLMEQPNLAVAMKKAHMAVASATLRAVVIHELIRLNTDDPDLKGWARVSTMLGKASVDPSGVASFEASVYPSVDPSDTGSVKAARKGDPNPSGQVSPTTSPSPATSPTPSPELVDSELEGDRYETLRASSETVRPRCTRHPHGNPTDEKCRGCRRERDWDEAQDRKTLAALHDAANNCAICEGTHFVLDDNKMPTRRKCNDHRRTA